MLKGTRLTLLRMAYIGPAFLLLVVTSGCTTAGGQGQGSSAETRQLLLNLNRTVTGSMQRMNETTAELLTRIESSEQQTLRLLSIAEENQMRLDNLQRNLDDLTATLYRSLNLTANPGTRNFGDRIQPGRSPGTDVGGSSVTSERPATPLTIVDPVIDAEEERAALAIAHYDRAQGYYKSKEYLLGEQEFGSFLKQYANTERAGAAQHWRGMCLFRLNQYQEAIAELELVEKNYPESDKVPWAIHTQAVAYTHLNQPARAMERLKVIIRDYPDGVVAVTAREHLKLLQEAAESAGP